MTNYKIEIDVNFRLCADIDLIRGSPLTVTKVLDVKLGNMLTIFNPNRPPEKRLLREIILLEVSKKLQSLEVNYQELTK